MGRLWRRVRLVDGTGDYVRVGRGDKGIIGPPVEQIPRIVYFLPSSVQ